MEPMKEFTQQEFDALPGSGAASILNNLPGNDGVSSIVMPYGRGFTDSGKQVLVNFYEEGGKRYKRWQVFTPVLDLATSNQITPKS